MKNVLNNIFGISQRSKGKIEDDGTVTIQEILSYDLVANPSFSDANFSDIEEQKRLLDLLKRQELLKNRKEKINKLNNL